MFCFEAGRSSPCGQGVFAFKSKKAKQIFDTIKEELSKVKLKMLSHIFHEFLYLLKCCIPIYNI